MRVAIIGAGACGLYLGWKLAKKGHDVTVFEKNKVISDKACSGLFSERILEYVPEAKGLIEKEINSVLINFPRKTVKINFSRRFLFINHSKLDVLLADLAHQVGVKIVLDKNISQIPEGFDRIIGCDGADSFVRKSLNLKSPYLRLGIQGFVRGGTLNNYIEAFVCKNGFLWKIRRSTEIEYGVITDVNRAHKTLVDFTNVNKIVLHNVRAKIIPQGLIIPKNDTITLCGDAAGLTKPWSGGGVVWGFKAADILLKNFPNFKKYRKEVKLFFYQKIILSKVAIKIIYFLGYNFPWFLPKTAKIESDFLF